MSLLALMDLFAAITQVSAQQHAAHVAPSLPSPLFALPVISRVQIDIARERIVVLHEVVIARGDFHGGDLDLWISFGPTMPRAFDAHLLSVHAGASAPDAADAGEPIAYDKHAHRPAQAHPLLGRSTMAGAVLHVREPALRRAFAASDVLALRIREVLTPPAPDAQNARELVVRLGMESGTPLTVRRLALSTPEPAGFITAASAELCGPSADTYILGFQTLPHGVRTTLGAIDPAAATRHASDDLCVRYETVP